MGRARIIAGGNKGFYKAEIIKHPGVSTERLKKIEQLLINIDNLISNSETAYNALFSAIETAMSTLSSTVMQYISGAKTYDDVTAAKTAVLAAEKTARDKKTETAYLKLQKVSLTKEKAILDSAMASEQKYLWCADYTEDILNGREVGTIEVDGDNKWINITPGGKKDTALGTLQPVACSTPAGVFVNLALMPCWQRHKPTYRCGKITIVNYSRGTCSVVLDNPNYSRATNICHGSGTKHDNININLLTDAENVKTIFNACECTYMGKAADVFVVGDHVIVEFVDRSWQKPRIIGFHDNPRPVLDIIQLRFAAIAGNDNFTALCDEFITINQTMADYFQYAKETFFPQYISALESLNGKTRSLAYSSGVLWGVARWTLADINVYADPWREFIGIDVYSDGKLNFQRMIAQDYIDKYLGFVTEMTTMKTYAASLATVMRVSLSGHIWPSLNTLPAVLLEGTSINIQVAVVDEELSGLKGPSGTSDFSKLRNQAIEAERIWGIYASVVKTGWILATGKVYMPQIGLATGDKIIINKTEGGLALPAQLTEDATYVVTVLSSTDTFMYITLTDEDGAVVVFPSSSDHNIAFRYRKKTSAPVLDLTLTAGVVSFKLSIVGIVDKSGEFYILTYDPSFTSSYITITNSKFTVYVWEDGQDDNKQALYDFPNAFSYGCVHWPIKSMTFAEEKKLNFSVSITGRHAQLPEEFGGTIQVKSESGGWSVNVNSSELSFCRLFFPGKSFTDLFSHIPIGFFWFASKYYDHPITTGIDNHELKYLVTAGMTDEAKAALQVTKDALVLWVNTYVNQHYTYLLDLADEWEFMGPGRLSGDCEDFALTKINMLLNLGFSIDDFKLQGGYPSTSSSIVIGHMWVLYRNSIVLDNNYNGAFKTQAEMLAVYPDEIRQIKGMRWYHQNQQWVLPASWLWPFENYNIEILTGNLYVKKIIR